MSKSELAFLTARLCESRSSIWKKSQFWNSNHHPVGMMLEICSMICIIYAMHYSKRNLTPMICYHWVMVISLWCVALLGSVKHTMLWKVLGQFTSLYKWKNKTWKKITMFRVAIIVCYKRTMGSGEDIKITLLSSIAHTRLLRFLG
jgi:hypothetical protein